MKKSGSARRRLQGVIETAKAESSKNVPSALNTSTRALVLSLELEKPDFGLTQYCLNNVGKTLVDIGDYERAVGLLESALEKARKAYGDVHALVEHPCQSLGRAYTELGDLDKALDYWNAAAFSAERMRGVYHQSTIFCLSRKARALRQKGFHEEALTVFCKVFGRTQTVFGCGLQTAFAARELAACYCQLGRFEEAIPVWKHALRCFDECPAYQKQGKNVKRCLSWTRSQAAAAKTLVPDAESIDFAFARNSPLEIFEERLMEPVSMVETPVV